MRRARAGRAASTSTATAPPDDARAGEGGTTPRSLRAGFGRARWCRLASGMLPKFGRRATSAPARVSRLAGSSVARSLGRYFRVTRDTPDVIDDTGRSRRWLVPVASRRPQLIAICSESHPTREPTPVFRRSSRTQRFSLMGARLRRRHRAGATVKCLNSRRNSGTRADDAQKNSGPKAAIPCFQEGSVTA